MSFVAAIAERLAAHPSLTILAEGSGEDRKTVSAATLLARAASFREGLVELGIRLGDRVGLIAANHVDWVACDLAVLAEGAVLIPLDPRSTPAEQRALLTDAEPSLILTDVERPPLEVVRDGKTVPQRVLAELAREHPARWTTPRDVVPDALATIIYTSGSSGEPKGAMLTRLNLDFMLAQTEQRLADLTGLPFGRERALHYLPLCYAGSRVLLLSCLLRGARVELVADPKEIADRLKPAKPDYFLNVPLLLDRFQRAVVDGIEQKGGVASRLLREATAAAERREAGESSLRDRVLLGVAHRILYGPIRARFGGRLRGLICGSAPLAESTQRFFERAGIPVYQGYGLTETTALCTLDAPGQVRAGWVGAALPGVELTRSEEGELLTRGPHVFAGYWGKPEATREAFAEDGWFRTGDLGEVDEAGRWQISGRRSAVLVLRTGHNVAPEPLEEALRAGLVEDLGPGLADAQVVVLGHGRPHVVALIASPTPLDRERVEDTLTRINLGFPPPKRIRRFALVTEPFSAENGLLTTNLKLRRKAIAERFADEVEALYARSSSSSSSAVGAQA